MQSVCLPLALDQSVTSFRAFEALGINDITQTHYIEDDVDPPPPTLSLPLETLHIDAGLDEKQCIMNIDPSELEVHESYESASDSDIGASTPTTPQTDIDHEQKKNICDDDDLNGYLPTPRPTISRPSSADSYLVSDSDDDEDEDEEADCYQDYVDNILPHFQWQNEIQNEENYGPIHASFQKELMNNPFFTITPSDFNDILRRVQFIRSRWMGDKIRSKQKGSLNNINWKKGEKISESELFGIKLYTDFENAQRELKKCYRTPKNDSDPSQIEIYEQRLCHFSHWRRLLNVSIKKYGLLLKDRVFYHGINQIMQLDIHPTHRYSGPFSVTSDMEIARGFSTKNGIILEMMSKYPRLDTDYFYDAAEISAYPDEKEWLIGFMYSRILCVYLGCVDLSLESLNEERMKILACFVISSLIKNNLYSYGEHLEKIFHALLITDSENYSNHNFDDALVKLSQKISTEIKKEFLRIRKEQKVLKLDRISKGMKELFYENDTNVLCMEKIYKFMPNLNELHLYESHVINDEFISQIIRFLKRHRDDCSLSLSAIKLFKYCFKGSSKQFQFECAISKRHLSELSNLGWNVYEVHGDNFYKFGLKKK